MAIAMFLTFCAVFFFKCSMGVLDRVRNAFFTHSLLIERFLKCKSSLYLVTIYSLLYCVFNLISSNVPNISLPLILLYFIVLSKCSISLWELPEKNNVLDVGMSRVTYANNSLSVI